MQINSTPNSLCQIPLMSTTSFPFPYHWRLWLSSVMRWEAKISKELNFMPGSEFCSLFALLLYFSRFSVSLNSNGLHSTLGMTKSETSSWMSTQSLSLASLLSMDYRAHSQVLRQQQNRNFEGNWKKRIGDILNPIRVLRYWDSSCLLYLMFFWRIRIWMESLWDLVCIRYR